MSEHKKYQINLLQTELKEYYRRMEYADRYDNYGDKLWYAELIARTEADLDRLEKAR